MSFGETGRGLKKVCMFAYRVVGKRITRFLPLFRDMDKNLLKAGTRISFRAYVSLVILVALLVTACFSMIIPLTLVTIFDFPLGSSLLFGTGGSLLAGVSMVIAFYAYPIYRADSLKRNLEDGLPFITSYMAILAGAGVPSSHIFRSLAQLEDARSRGISDEARIITRDVELFGFDIFSALRASSKRAASSEFKEMLEGFLATIRSGGNLTKYLMTRSRQHMKLKRIAMRRFSDNLGILAEFYVTLFIAGPLLFVVMLAVMAMLGGGGQGLLNPRLLLQLLTYLGIPMGSVVFLIILDVFSLRR